MASESSRAWPTGTLNQNSMLVEMKFREKKKRIEAGSMVRAEKARTSFVLNLVPGVFNLRS